MRQAILPLLIVSAAACLLGCATPEELAVARQKAERQSQTGSNIARGESGARVSSVTDKDAQDAMLNEMRRVPVQPAFGAGPSP